MAENMREDEESFFSSMSKRRRGYPSETRVKRGDRVVHGNKEFIRETGSQRSLPVRVGTTLSRSAASGADASTALRGTTTDENDRRICTILEWRVQGIR
jgi:hypothetical protein